jgi:hypothetical protein
MLRLSMGMKRRVVPILLVTCGSLGPVACKRNRPVRNAISYKSTMQEAYVYGFPMVMNYGVMYEMFVNRSSSQYKGSFNRLYSDARVLTPRDKAVNTPNSDTPYSMLAMDLRTEPLVLCVPKIDKTRYYSVQLVDMYTFNYAYIGSRTTGSDAGCYMVAGPDWKGDAPTGINKVFRSETQLGLAIYRTQLFSSKDMPNVKRVQSGYTVEPLSAFAHQPAPPAAPPIEFPSFSKDDMKLPFPKILNFVLQFCPIVDSERDLRAKFATVGIETGKPFDVAKLSGEKKIAEGLAVKDGFEAISKKRSSSTDINGWGIGEAQGNREALNGNWLLRATAAASGIYGNDPSEATYFAAQKDRQGEALDGSKHSYAVTFAPGQLPPVNAFWSITMYDGESQLLIENPLNRYLINSPMLPSMRKSKDGSLTIYIQKDAPAAEKKSNWLPAPNGSIYMVMRLYWPGESPPSVLPPGSPTWKPPVIEVTQ